jgi:flagellar biosynthesis/type III secretory pathway protein FliH
VSAGPKESCRDAKARFERVCDSVLPGIRVLPGREAAKLRFLQDEIARLDAACAHIPAELDRLREAARKEGAEAGYREGRGDAIALVTEALRFRAETHEALSVAAIELAFSIAKRLLEREMDRNPAVFAGLVSRWRCESCAADCAIRLNPADATAIEAEGADLNGASVIADPSLPRGACRIETGDDILDVGLDARLEALRDAAS